MWVNKQNKKHLPALEKQTHISVPLHWSGYKFYHRGSRAPIFFFFFLISWRLITLQYRTGFCHTLTWISHGYTCIPHPNPPSHLPLHPIPLGLPSAPGPGTCLMHPTWAGDLFHTRVKQGTDFESSKVGTKVGLAEIFSDRRAPKSGWAAYSEENGENADVGRGAGRGECSERCQIAFSSFNLCFNLVLHTEKERKILYYSLFHVLFPQGPVFSEQWLEGPYMKNLRNILWKLERQKIKQKTFLSLRERGKEEFSFCLQGQRREGLRETNNPVTTGQIIRICLYRIFPLTLKVLPKYVGSKYNDQ